MRVQLAAAAMLLICSTNAFADPGHGGDGGGRSDRGGFNGSDNEQSPNGNADIAQSLREAQEAVNEAKKNPTDDAISRALELSIGVEVTAALNDEEEKGNGWSNKAEKVYDKAADICGC